MFVKKENLDKNIYRNIIILLFLFSQSILGIKFYFQMEKTSMRCLGEYLSDKTLGNLIL